MGAPGVHQNCDGFSINVPNEAKGTGVGRAGQGMKANLGGAVIINKVRIAKWSLGIVIFTEENVKRWFAFVAKSIFIIAIITEALEAFFLKLALGEAVCGAGEIRWFSSEGWIGWWRSWSGER